MHSIIWTLLFTATSAYRIMEFSQPRCSHREFRAHHLAEANSCTKLEPRVSSSILVKIDNIHDSEYQLNVYDSKDCTGDIVGSITDLNGCMTLFSEDHVGRSVKLTPIDKPADPDTITRGFITDHNYNMLPFPAETHFSLHIPVAYGMFRPIDKPEIAEDGTYLDEAIPDYWPKPLKHMNSIDATSDFVHKAAENDEIDLVLDWPEEDYEKWHERFLSQAQYLSNRVYAAAAGWGERVLGVA